MKADIVAPISRVSVISFWHEGKACIVKREETKTDLLEPTEREVHILARYGVLPIILQGDALEVVPKFRFLVVPFLRFIRTFAVVLALATFRQLHQSFFREVSGGDDIADTAVVIVAPSPFHEMSLLSGSYLAELVSQLAIPFFPLFDTRPELQVRTIVRVCNPSETAFPDDPALLEFVGGWA